MKIRIKFRKYGVMKFIGHLDIMRYFQKAIRRAEIPISYSGGYSPHMIMSFASPLGVGLTSDGEYFDIESEHCLPSREAVSRLNDAMVEGMEVLSYRLLGEDAKNAMSIVGAADYRVTVREDFPLPEEFEQRWKAFCELHTIPIRKKTKKSETVVDIKPLMLDVELCKGNIIYMKLSSGSVDNLKPELVMQAFSEFSGIELPVSALLIHRMELYARGEDGGFVSLEELGEEIADETVDNKNDIP